MSESVSLVNMNRDVSPLFDWSSISRRKETAPYEKAWNMELPPTGGENAGERFEYSRMCQCMYQPQVLDAQAQPFWTYVIAHEPEDAPQGVPILSMESPASELKTKDEGAANVVSNASVFETELARLEECYDLEDQVAVREFVRAHPELLALLMEARAEIDLRFPGANVILRVVTDPEVPNRQDLYVGIETDLCVNDALSRLGELDEGWWLDRVDQADGLMCVDVKPK